MKKKSLFILAMISSLWVMLNVKADEEYSELFKKVAPDNVFEVNAVKPKDQLELEDYSANKLRTIDEKLSGFLSDCNEDYSICNLQISDGSDVDEMGYPVIETHEVNVLWQTGDEEALAKINETKEKILAYDNASHQFILTDLGLIKYLYDDKNTSFITNSVIAGYIKELREISDYANISYTISFRMGEDSLLWKLAGGGLLLSYNGVTYASTNDDISIIQKYIVYIPDDIENTNEAYIAAAKNRIDKYLNEDIKIELGDTIESLEENPEIYTGLEFMTEEPGEYTYNITINGKAYPFLIIKDSSKISDDIPVTSSKDFSSSVAFETTAVDVPSDAILTAQKITEDNENYNNILETLKVKDFVSYDISLYSKSLNSNITKTEKGTFKVTLPVPETLKDKDLMVYYINDDKTIERYNVTLDENGNAVFETKHFSVYTLAEASEEASESNPNTLDSIPKSLAVLVSSLALLSIVLYALLKNSRD